MTLFYILAKKYKRAIICLDLSVYFYIKQIFLRANGFNDAKMSLINGKIYNFLAFVNLEQIKNWKSMKST